MSLSGRNTQLKTEHIWDVFVILTLLCDHEARGRLLDLPHDGHQKDRFTAAMEERNLRIIREGQSELSHRCKKCTRVYEWHDEDGTLRHGECSLVFILAPSPDQVLCCRRHRSACHDRWFVYGSSTLCSPTMSGFSGQ